MSITDNNSIQIIEDGTSTVLRMRPVNYKVYVEYGGTTTGTLTPKTGVHEDRLIEFETPDGATITDSYVFEMSGPGLLAFECASLANGPIRVDIQDKIV